MREEARETIITLFYRCARTKNLAEKTEALRVEDDFAQRLLAIALHGTRFTSTV